MIDGTDLRDFYVDLWRRLPKLLDAVGGDEGKIRSSEAVANIAKSLQREVLSMPEESIFVTYQGFTKANEHKGEVIKHEIAAFIRSSTGDNWGGWMVDGIPDGQADGQNLSVRKLAFNEDLNPMDMPRYERVSASELTIDIWKLTFGVVQNFD